MPSGFQAFGSAEGYVGTHQPAPTVSAIVPPIGPNAAGLAVTITGVGFTGATGATIGGVACTGVVVVNDTTVTAVAPALSGGAHDVAVTASSGTGTLTNGFYSLAINAWYHADDASVSSWASRGGSGGANTTAAQATGVNQPTISASSNLNNKTAVKFADAADAKFMVTGVWGSAPSQPRSVYVSAFQTGVTGNHYIFDALSGHRMGGFATSTRTNIDGYAGGGPAGASSGGYAGVSHVMGFEFNGASSNVYVDALTSASGTIDLGTDSATGFTIGNFAGTAAGFSGWEIRQLIVVTGALSLADRTQLMNYLGTDINKTIGP